MLVCRRPRIDLYADLGCRGDRESVVDESEEVSDLRRREISWRAAAPMQLLNRSSTINFVAHQYDFALEILDVG